MITDQTKISKFLSLVLRHKPETIDLKLDEQGWADTNFLITAMQNNGYAIDMDILKEIVASSDKQRFKFNDDFTQIRANQGHSIEVDLNFGAKTPPEVLYHGTATKNLESIKQHGLLKQSRHHVHLSADAETARTVGMRYGKPVVFKIEAQKMFNDGITFYQSENGIWLTEFVAPKYIIFEE